MNSFLLFLAGLVALAMGALFAVPYFVDWNDYRDVFKAQATKLIGRNVDVGGDVSLTLLPAPVLRFQTINVADAKGSFDTPFAAAQSFTVWLSVPPLLRGSIVARSVEIDQPVINFRIAKDGSGNWSDIGGEAVDIPFIPKDVALNSVEMSSATINFWRGKPEPDSVIEQLDGELSARSLQGPYKFTGQFTLGEKLRDLRFSTGRMDEKGEFRLKASMRSPEEKVTYAIN
ncbi:MAG: AsmA family protein, partial [Hyphomicrobiaceae bacterium]|nr:AsmA family protein [Hyphomicrobiaceae bacterium]